MVDILFIIPPFKYYKLDLAAAVCPRLGIASIASVLEENGFRVRIIDAMALRLTLSDIRKQIIKNRPALVGLTAATAEFPPQFRQ